MDRKNGENRREFLPKDKGINSFGQIKRTENEEIVGKCMSKRTERTCLDREFTRISRKSLPRDRGFDLCG